MKKYKKGFTILELLVVIAIIGILAAVVLAAVGSSRGKAADKAIISDLEGIRTQAELYLSSSTSKSYGTFNAVNTAGANGRCPASTFSTGGAYNNSIFLDTSSTNPGATYTTILNKAITDANLKSSGGVSPTTFRLDNARCVSTGTSWALAAKLKTSNKSWCVDSNGNSKEVSQNASTNAGVISVTGTVATCS